MSQIPSSPRALLPAFKPKGPPIHRDSPEDDGYGAVATPPCSSPRALDDSPSMYNDDDDNDGIDGLKSLQRDVQTRQEYYPTPLPSSSRDDGLDQMPSSPTGQAFDKEDYDVEDPSVRAECPRKVTTRTPLSAVALVRVPRTGKPVRIGRSSKSCEVALSSKNRLVSRVHAQVYYDNETNTVLVICEGWNGLKVSIPVINDEESLDYKGGYPNPQAYDEYDLFQGEKMEASYVPGITVDVRGERALVEVLEENSSDETEDELVNENENENEVQQSTVQVFEDPQEKQNEEKEPSEEKEKESRVLQPLQHHEVIDKQPASPVQNHGDSSSEKENVLKRPSEAVEPEQPKQPATPKSSATNKKKKTKRSQVEPEYQHLDESELLSITHIIANHLAFSRLAQSPISVIQKSNSRLANLPKKQLSEIVQTIGCVGVIRRSGKDAAGKPLEEEYYYEGSNDDDQDRVAMVQQMRGGGSLRSCRKTHKQYFWKKPR